MKEVRRIKFTGKNLNDVFNLPCVSKIIKIVKDPQLILLSNMLVLPILPNVVRPGDDIIQFDNGLWKVVPHTSDISHQTSPQ